MQPGLTTFGNCGWLLGVSKSKKEKIVSLSNLIIYTIRSVAQLSAVILLRQLWVIHCVVFAMHIIIFNSQAFQRLGMTNELKCEPQAMMLWFFVSLLYKKLSNNLYWTILQEQPKEWLDWGRELKKLFVDRWDPFNSVPNGAMVLPNKQLISLEISWNVYQLDNIMVNKIRP